MGDTTSISPEKRARIIKAVTHGEMTYVEIGRVLNVSARTVQRAVKRYKADHPEWDPPTLTYRPTRK